MGEALSSIPCKEEKREEKGGEKKEVCLLYDRESRIQHR